MRITICLFLILSIFFGCSKSIGDVKPHNYETEIKPILVTHCTQSGCHDGSQKKLGNFSNYDDVQKYITPGFPSRSELYIQISGASPEMPPKDYPSITPTDVYNIRHWIARGAPNDIGVELICDSSAAGFTKSVFPIVQTWCTGCHSESSPAAGIALYNYTTISAASQQANFIGSITHNSQYSAMPKNTNALSACDIAILKRWVNNGSPND